MTGLPLMLWILSTATPAELAVTAGVLIVASLAYAVRASRLRFSRVAGRSD